MPEGGGGSGNPALRQRISFPLLACPIPPPCLFPPPWLPLPPPSHTPPPARLAGEAEASRSATGTYFRQDMPPPAMRTQGRLALFVVAAAVAALAAHAAPAAYGQDAAEVSNAPGSSVRGCEVNNECFVPANAMIDEGGTVTWSNDDSAGHTVTGGSAEGGGPDGSFDSGLLMPDTTFAHTFEDAGEYPYYCIVHPWMAGLVTVSAAGGGGGDIDAGAAGPGSGGGGGGATVLGDGTEIKILTTDPAEGSRMGIIVEVVNSEHINYDIRAYQGGAVVLEDLDAHDHDGVNEHETDPLGSADPVTVVFAFKGYGMGEMSGPIGETYTLSSDSTASTATGMLSDGTVVEIVASDPIEGHRMGIALRIGGSGDIAYDIVATQGGTTVLDEKMAHDHDGLGNHETDVLGSSDPVDIAITFQGYESHGGEMGGSEMIGEQVVFTNIVPEFGAIAAAVLAVAIAAIVAATARSRGGLIPRA